MPVRYSLYGFAYSKAKILFLNQGGLMNLQSNNTWKGVLSFAMIALIAGCAPKAYLTTGSVPNPVLLGGPSHIKTEKKVVDVTVVPMKVAVTTNAGGASITQEATKEENANKTSEEINSVTHGNTALDVQLSKLSVGAYYYGLGNLSVIKNWVHIKGGLSEAGKEIK
jgi:hypothetical protein